MPPRVLYFKQVPGYVLEKHGITIHPLAAYNWSRYKSVRKQWVTGRKGKCVCLNFTRMAMGTAIPRLLTTARDVDDYLRQTGAIK